MALYQRCEIPNGGELAIWKIEEDERLLVSSLPQKEKFLEEAYHRFTSSTRRIEWLAVRRALYELLGKDFDIDYLPSGKPYLRDKSYKISISHTRGYVAVVIHPELEIGLDVEQISSKVKRVRSRYVSAQEAEGIPPDNEEKELKMLLLLWSGKETLFKLLDKENVDFIQHLHIASFELSDSGCFQAWETRTARCLTYKIYYRIYADFVLTWGHCS